MNSGRGLVRGDGVLTAGIAVAGSAGDAKGEDCELYDGTNWTEVNDLNTPRTGAAVFGTTTAAYAASGDNAGAATNFNNEEWNGTSWSEEANVNTARIKHGGVGIATLGLIFGGLISPAPPERVGGETEEWDGTSWTEVGDLNLDRRNPGCDAGTGTLAVFAGGDNPTPGLLNDTEEWSQSASVETVAFD